MHRVHQSPLAQDKVDLFRQLSREFSEHARSEGIRVIPYHDEALPHFSKLDSELQQAAVIYLQNHLQVFRELKGEKRSLKDSPRFLWRALSALGYIPSSDIFGYIEDGDVIEIYTPAMTQVFRSLNFFTFTNLTLEDICSFPVHELIEFPPSILMSMIEIAGRFARHEVHETFDPKIPAYEWIEKFTDAPCKAITQIKWLSPARKENGDYVILVINRSQSV